MRRILLVLLCGFLLATVALAADFTLTSTAFQDHHAIPKVYGCDGKNISPPLRWENPPANTKSFVLTLLSPGWAASDTYKWLVYNLPATTKALGVGANADLPEGALTGTNSLHDAIYRGPCPPDANPHDYIFTLYALDTVLTLDEKAEVDELLPAIKHHIIKQAVLTGTFQH